MTASSGIQTDLDSFELPIPVKGRHNLEVVLSQSSLVSKPGHLVVFLSTTHFTFLAVSLIPLKVLLGKIDPVC